MNRFIQIVIKIAQRNVACSNIIYIIIDKYIIKSTQIDLLNLKSTTKYL